MADSNPSNELKLGAFRKENLKYRLTDDPTAVHSKTGESKLTSQHPEDRAIAEKITYGILFLKETAVFVFFIGVFLAVVFLTSPPYAYESVALVKQIFITPGDNSLQQFMQIGSEEDVVRWLRGVLIPSIFLTADSTGKNLGIYERQFVRGGNRVLGPVRIRQVRSNGDCYVSWLARTLRVKDCAGSSHFINSMEETRPYGMEYYVNGVRGFSDQEVDALVAQGMQDNVTQFPTRFTHSSSEELCSDVPNPERDTGSFVDSKSRVVRGANKGLSWYCAIGSATTGQLGVTYPDGGYVLDFPPVSWYKKFDDYQTAKLLLARDWNKRHGPFGPLILGSTTQTLTKVVPPVPYVTETVPQNITITTYTRQVDEVITPTASKTQPPDPTATVTDESLYFPEAPSKRDHSLVALDDLLEHYWIDNRTSMISVEFTLYNPNTNIIISCRFVFDFLSSGSVLPYFAIRPMLLPVWETASEKVVMMAEVFLFTFVLYYAMQEAMKIVAFFSTNWRHCQVCALAKIEKEHLERMIVCPNCQRHFNPFSIPCCPDCYFDVEKSHKCWRGYFLNFWNIVDLVNITIFFVVFAIRFKLRADIGNVSLVTETQFMQMFSVADQYALSNYLNAANIMMTFFKTIKYLGRIQTLSVLIRTISIAVAPCFWFFVVFGIIYVGFSLSFVLAFADTYDFRDNASSLMSLFRMLIYQFNYFAMQRSQQYLAPILFLIYNTAMVLVLSNIFISIIDESYQKARVLVYKGRVDYLNSSLKHLFQRVVRKVESVTGAQSDTLDKFRMLGKSIFQSPSLSNEERDEVRQMVQEILEKQDLELIHDVLIAFHNDVTRVMRQDDLELLKVRIKEVHAERLQALSDHYGENTFWSKGVSEPEDTTILTCTDKQNLRYAANERKESFLKGRQLVKRIATLEEQLSEQMAILNILARSGAVQNLDLDIWIFDPTITKPQFVTFPSDWVDESGTDEGDDNSTRSPASPGPLPASPGPLEINTPVSPRDKERSPMVTIIE